MARLIVFFKKALRKLLNDNQWNTLKKLNYLWINRSDVFRNYKISGGEYQSTKSQVLKWSIAKDSVVLISGGFDKAVTSSIPSRSKAVCFEELPVFFDEQSKRVGSKSNFDLRLGRFDLAQLENEVQGKDVTFILDNHWCSGSEILHPDDVTVKDDLSKIDLLLPTLSNVTVIIDDIDCFNPHSPLCAKYPPIHELIHWLVTNKFTYSVECNMLIGKRNQAFA